MSKEKGRLARVSFYLHYPRLGAGEACNAETSTGVNKKYPPSKACSPSPRKKKGAAGLTAGKPTQPAPWVSTGT